MSNPYLPPESDLRDLQSPGVSPKVRKYKLKHWIRAVCVFAVVTPTAIATILFVLALFLGLPMQTVGSVASMTSFSRAGLAVAVVGGIYTGIKSARETLPLDTAPME